MALKKQSIRKGMNIIANGDPISKDELILISESWSEIQESFFIFSQLPCSLVSP